MSLSISCSLDEIEGSKVRSDSNSSLNGSDARALTASQSLDFHQQGERRQTLINANDQDRTMLLQVSLLLLHAGLLLTLLLLLLLLLCCCYTAADDGVIGLLLLLLLLL